MRQLRRALLLLALCAPALHVPAFAAPPRATATPEELYEYSAVQGDTLTSISARFLDRGPAWQQLLKYNRLANPDHINPGEIIRIPLALMKRDAAPAGTVTTLGDVQVLRNGATVPLQVGQQVAKGDEVRTGKDSYVVIKLADGSLLKLPAESRLLIETTEKVRDTNAVRSVLRLISGRIEALVTKFRGSGNRFEVTTEQAVTGVRGTHFRVGADGGASTSEVLEGRVNFAGAGPAEGKNADLPAGFGSRADSSGNVLPATELLPPPALSAAPALQERLVVRFVFPALPGAQKYRAQVSRDEDFNQVVSETVIDTPNVRFAGLEDQKYFLRVHGIDSNGLEGRDAVLPFTLKARPEPPLISGPADKGKVRTVPVDFAWATVSNTAKYRMQVARDAAFADVVFDSQEIADTKVSTPASLPLGSYFWRVRTIEGSDIGPWSDVRTFQLLAPPAAPEPPQLDGNNIKFSWSGEPGQTFVFQVSRDAKFGTLLFEEKLDKPELNKPRPRSGTYYMRYRAIDSDGFEGPFTSAQRFMVEPPKVGSSTNIFSGDE